MIEVIIGDREFACLQVNDKKFRATSSDRSEFVRSVAGFVNFVDREVGKEQAQIAEWNEEFADRPEQQISFYQIPEEMKGSVDTEIVRFDDSGTFAGHHPWTAEF